MNIYSPFSSTEKPCSPNLTLARACQHHVTVHKFDLSRDRTSTNCLSPTKKKEKDKNPPSEVVHWFRHGHGQRLSLFNQKTFDLIGKQINAKPYRWIPQGNPAWISLFVYQDPGECAVKCYIKDSLVLDQCNISVVDWPCCIECFWPSIQCPPPKTGNIDSKREKGRPSLDPSNSSCAGKA